MAMKMAAFYLALSKARAADEDAQKATEAVAGELLPIKWMLGFNLAITVAVLTKLLS